jgi:hypothetical protein
MARASSSYPLGFWNPWRLATLYVGLLYAVVTGTLLMRIHFQPDRRAPNLTYAEHVREVEQDRIESRNLLNRQLATLTACVLIFGPPMVYCSYRGNRPSRGKHPNSNQGTSTTVI